MGATLPPTTPPTLLPLLLPSSSYCSSHLLPSLRFSWICVSDILFESIDLPVLLLGALFRPSYASRRRRSPESQRHLTQPDSFSDHRSLWSPTLLSSFSFLRCGRCSVESPQFQP